MRVLILGSDGQIGRELTHYLEKKEHQVVQFDITSNKEQDLRIPSVLEGILPEIDFVFFLAFDVGGSIYLEKYQDSYEFISNNIKIMEHTFSSIKKYGKTFVFVSSSMSNMTYSTYGLLKKIGEKYTESLDYGKFIRLWNVYGYEKDPDKFHVITDFINMAKKDNQITIKTDGTEERQFLYAEDCCECLALIMDKFDQLEKKSFDISSFHWTPIYDVANIISLYFNNCSIIKGESIDTVQRNSKIEPSPEILKYWSPKTNLIQGIDRVIKSMK